MVDKLAVAELNNEYDTIIPHARAAKIKVSDAELILFTNQLSIMLESGVVLSDALDAIAQQSKQSPFQTVIFDLGEKIRSGQSFSDALSFYPGIFNSMFVSMVKASELSGKMSDMLEVLSSYLNSDSETKKQVKGAMVYPLIMLFMSIAATGSLMFFVLPRFTKIYESRGADLPGLTQVLVNCSQTLGDPKIMAFVVTTLLVLMFLYNYWKSTVGGQKVLDSIRVHTPVFGTMFTDATLTRSMRVMATMLNTGVSLLDALKVLEYSCDNIHFRHLWLFVDQKIRDGYQFSEAIKVSPQSNLIAPGMLQMLKAGEKSGNLGRVCDRISLFYEKKLQNSIKMVTSLIEPVMITIMGGVIGTIAIALLLPVFKISSIVAH